MRALLFALLLLPFPAFAQDAAQEERDRGFLTGLIEDNLSSTARQVIIEGFDGALSSRATVERLTIADGEGVWLEATDLALDWNRSALFGGRLEVEELSAGSISILRAPVPDPDALPSPEASPFSLPELPVAIEIGRLDVDQIILGEALLGDALVLTFSGGVSLAGGEGEAAFTADIVEGSTGSLALTASYSNATRVLALDLDLEEAEGGLAARALGLPGLPSVALSLNGTGPIEDYAATLSLATDGEERIQGALGVVTTAAATPGQPPARAFDLDITGDVTPLVAPDLRDFFGPEVSLRVVGDRDGAGALSLSTLEIGSRALTLSGDAEITPEGWPERLRLDGNLGGENGEPVILPGAGGATVQSATIDVAYDRSQGDAWTGSFDVVNLASPGLAIPSLTLSGGGTIVPATDAAPGRFAADLDYAATGIAVDDESLAQALGADIGGTISLVRPGDGGPLRLTSLTLSGPGVEAVAEGTIAGAGVGFLTESSVMLRAEDLTRFAALTGLDLAGSADLSIVSAIRPLDGIFDLNLSGTTQDLALGITELDPLLAGTGEVTVAAARDEAGTRIETLRIETPAVTLSGDADVTSGESRAQFELALADLGLSFPTLSGPGRITGNATRDAAGLARLDAEAALPGAVVSLNASQPAATDDATGAEVTAPVTLALTAEVEELADYATLIATYAPDLGVAPRGAATLDVSGTAAQDASTFDLEVSATTRDLGLGIATLDPLLAGDGSLLGQATRTGPASLRVEGLRVSTDILSGTVSAAIEDGVGSADLDLALTDVATILPGLSGPASVTGQASRDAAGALDLDLAATLPSGTASIDGILAPAAQGGAFTGDASVDVADIAPFGALIGRDIGGAVQADLSGTYGREPSVIELDFDATTRDIRVGVPQLDPLLAGAGSHQGRIGPGPRGIELAISTATPLLRGEANGTLTDTDGNLRFDIAVTEMASLAPGLSGPASAAGTILRDAAGVITVDADATAPGATASVDATIAPPAQAYEVAGTIAANVDDLAPWSRLAGRPLAGGIDATITGSLLPSLARFDLAIDAATRDLNPGDATLARVLAGAGTVAGRVIRDTDGGLRIQDLDARFPNLTVAADVTQGAETAIAFDARLADIALFVSGFSGPVTAEGTATLQADGRTRIAADVAGPAGIGARVDGSIGATADLRATGRAPLALANGILEPRRIDGVAAFDLTLRGPIDVGSLSGSVTLADARLTDPSLGTALTGIGGTVTLAGGTARLDLSGGLLDGGRLAVAGPVGLAAPFQADLAVTATSLVIRDPALYEAIATGALSVTGPLTGGARIAGAIDLASVEIRVPDSGVGALGDLPTVRHFQLPDPVAQTLARAGLTSQGAETEAAQATTGGGYPLDLTLRAPARVFIRGRGLDAELGGQLRLTGTTSGIIPVGQFDLLRGRLDILGQRFELTEGLATLQGDFIPTLRLIAETRARTGTVVRITVEGPATEPDVTFSSVPELPQDEVLAQLIFGQDLASITPFQAVQLASAVGTLAGRGGGLVDDLRGDAGLADLDITTDEGGNAALRLGRYIGENVYTDVIVSTAETQGTINLDLTPDLTVRAGVGSSGETTLGIEFARDY